MLSVAGNMSQAGKMSCQAGKMSIQAEDALFEANIILEEKWIFGGEILIL